MIIKTVLKVNLFQHGLIIILIFQKTLRRLTTDFVNFGRKKCAAQIEEIGDVPYV